MIWLKIGKNEVKISFSQGLRMLGGLRGNFSGRLWDPEVGPYFWGDWGIRRKYWWWGSHIHEKGGDIIVSAWDFIGFIRDKGKCHDPWVNGTQSRKIAGLVSCEEARHQPSLHNRPKCVLKATLACFAQSHTKRGSLGCHMGEPLRAECRHFGRHKKRGCIIWCHENAEARRARFL